MAKRQQGVVNVPLPYRPRPLPDESLASWFHRLATAYGYTPKEFNRIVLPQTRVYGLDIDWGHPQVQHGMAKLTASDPQAIAGNTLRRYDGLLWEAGLPLRNLASRFGKWVLPLDARIRVEDIFAPDSWGLQYCPVCLMEDQNPYFRLTWRLRLFTSCIAHGCLLSDECPKCKAPVHPFKGGLAGVDVMVDAEPLRSYVCGRCQGNLRDVDRVQISDRLRKLEGYHSQLLAATASVPRSNVREYFETLYELVGFLCREDTMNVFATEAGVRPVEFSHMGPVEAEPASWRAAVIETIAWIFEDWPSRAMAVVQECDAFRRRSMFDYIKSLPSLPKVTMTCDDSHAA